MRPGQGRDFSRVYFRPCRHRTKGPDVRALLARGWNPGAAPGYAACASATASGACASTAGPERICRTSGASRVSPEASTISAAAPYWVADTPTAAAIGPTTSAPSGIAPTDPRMSYADTRASRFGGTFRVTVTVHCTIMTSMAMPRPTAATQITGSG